MTVPDRAVIPLVAGVALGFIVGLIVSVQQMEAGAVWFWAGVVAVVAGVAGAASVLGVSGPASEKTTVGALRGALAAVLGALLVFGMVQFLRDGQVWLGLLLMGIALLIGLPLAQLRVRGRGGRARTS